LKPLKRIQIRTTRVKKKMVPLNGRKEEKKGYRVMAKEPRPPFGEKGNGLNKALDGNVKSVEGANPIRASSDERGGSFSLWPLCTRSKRKEL